MSVPGITRCWVQSPKRTTEFPRNGRDGGEAVFCFACVVVCVAALFRFFVKEDLEVKEGATRERAEFQSCPASFLKLSRRIPELSGQLPEALRLCVYPVCVVLSVCLVCAALLCLSSCLCCCCVCFACCICLFVCVVCFVCQPWLSVLLCC